mgnify:CR=1 FL=1
MRIASTIHELPIKFKLVNGYFNNHNMFMLMFGFSPRYSSNVMAIYYYIMIIHIIIIITNYITH